MPEDDTKKVEAEPPPILGSWRRVYWFVALFFFVEVALFYFFTRYFS